MSSTPLSKAELLSQLTNAKNNYILGLAAIDGLSWHVGCGAAATPAVTAPPLQR